MKISQRYQGIDLMNGFVFKSVFSGDVELCQQLVQVTTDIRISKVEIAQHEYEIEPTPKRRGGRVDLLVVDEQGNRYDVEVQAADHRNVVQRARHYQALMDVEQLKKGTDVKNLKKSVVVFICNFDPLMADLARYDIYTCCKQTKTEIDDGRLAIFLSTTGDRSGISPELSQLLDVFSGEHEDSSDDPFISDIIRRIAHLYNDREWLEVYMTLEEWYEERAEARAQELAEERAEALAEAIPAAFDKAMDSLGTMASADRDALRAALEQILSDAIRENARPGRAGSGQA